jgi:hypothetical protein
MENLLFLCCEIDLKLFAAKYFTQNWNVNIMAVEIIKGGNDIGRKS